MTATIWWVRRDLRLSDNAALSHAATTSRRVVPLFVDSDDQLPSIAGGRASRWWLHGSLQALVERLEADGSNLCIRSGDPLSVVIDVATSVGAKQIVWNRVHEPDFERMDAVIAARLVEAGFEVRTFGSGLTFEPGIIVNRENRAYRVFTAYWNARERVRHTPTLACVKRIEWLRVPGLRVDDLHLRTPLNRDEGIRQSWEPGFAAARRRVVEFQEEDLLNYPQSRDNPSETGTSRLSPHLHFGEVSAREIEFQLIQGGDSGLSGTAFRRQLAWREFASSLLHYHPHTTKEPLDSRFADFPWAESYDAEMRAWQEGMTGVPLVDAGMRQLRRTGWMHNRVRMVVASFLTKNLLVPWQEGVRWFADTLVDADLASNVMGWQWVAGCGADAAPFFRIFNPIRQGERFDPQGDYVRRWVPELARVPNRFIHQPHLAARGKLDADALRYPEPIVDLAATRQRALDAYNRHVRKLHV